MKLKKIIFVQSVFLLSLPLLSFADKMPPQGKKIECEKNLFIGRKWADTFPCDKTSGACHVEKNCTSFSTGDACVALDYKNNPHDGKVVKGNGFDLPKGKWCYVGG